jgi:hypothetical protein
MKKSPKKPVRGATDPDMLPEYDFRHAKRGTHAHLAAAHMVTIGPDVWAVFPSARAVNDALRAAVHIVKQARASRRGVA